MTKNEELFKNITPFFKDKNSFSLLIPYYSSDKWTNKLKNKVKSLAEAYKAFYRRLEKENSFNNDNEDDNSINNNGKHNKNNNKYFARTTTNLKSNGNNSNNIDFYNNQKNILNKILPPVTNYKNYENESKENTFNLNEAPNPYLSHKKHNIFCISAQQRNQKANMNKYYSNQKLKDAFYFRNNKNINSTRDLFSSKAHEDDYNKFISDFQNKKRISFFKKNDYNPRIKSTQPKNRKQIFEMKEIKKKQYLDYIKAKSEDNYMKYYYYQY